MLVLYRRWFGVVALLSVSFATAGCSSNSAANPEAKGSKAGSAASQVELIPRDQLFGNPDKAAARISPDGGKLSYLAPVDGVLNVWVGPADEPSAAKPVTQDKDRGIRSYFWAYTSNHILYIQDKDGDEDWHVYSVDLTSGETKDLTPLEKVNAQIEGVSHTFPEEILIGLNDRNKQLHDIYRVNISTGERELIQENPGFVGFMSDDDYRVRFAMSYGPDGMTIFEPDSENKDMPWKEFQKVGMQDTMTTSPAGFDKTGTKLYLIDSRERNTGALTVIDLESGDQKVIAENDKVDISDVMSHPTEKTIEAVGFTHLRKEWKVLDDSVADDLNYLRTVADGDVEVTSRTLDDKKWVVAYLMDNGPVRYYLYDRDAKKAEFLFTNRKSLEDLPLVKMHPVTVKSRDGLELVCYLSLPKGTDADDDARPDQPLPMVLDVHGGPWARDAWGFDPTHQLYANRGYAVMNVNFRGSTGFGKEFINKANKEWAGKMHDDLIDAVDWAIEQKIADPKKVAIMGGSYGGYATLVGLTFTPEKFACGVDIVGPSNLITLLNNVPDYWMPFMPVMKERVGDHVSEEGQKFLNERSPLNFVEKIKRPLLIAQGANDPRVKKQEAEQIVNAMQEKNIPVTYVLFPNEGHGFARPENSLAFNAVTEAFLAEHLGGRYEPIGDAFKESSITVPIGADEVPGLAKALPDEKKQPVTEEDQAAGEAKGESASE